MHIIVIGCGKVGSTFAQVLSEQGHDVVIVDNDSNSFKSLPSDFNGITITGVPIDQDVLKKAGITTAQAVAAVTPDDNINIMVCQVAKEIFKVPKVVARIYNPAREYVFHQFGLQTLCPTNITVEAIKSMVLGNKVISKHRIGDSEVAFKHEKAQNGSIGKKLSAVKVNSGSFIFGIIKDGKLHFASPDIMVNKDDVIIIANKSDN